MKSTLALNLSLKKALCSLALFALAATPFSNGLAATATFNFSNCLTGCTNPEPSVATLTLTDVIGGVSFEMLSTAPAGSFIGGLYFNGMAGSVGWSVSFQQYKNFNFSNVAMPNVSTAANGYNWDFLFPSANEQDRFLTGDVAKWTISAVNLDVTDFISPAKMMVHVQALPNGSSEKLSAVAVVPEPETYAMLLAGLGLMGAVARRRRSAI